MNHPPQAGHLALCAFAAPGIAVRAALAQQASPTTAGERKSAKTNALAAGAKTLQDNALSQPFDVCLVGFHPMKERPAMQVEAHHYCPQVNDDFAQCVLFGGNVRQANLNGIEYIISEKLFDTLPEQEKPYWHSHSGEILSGQLGAPGLSAAPGLVEKRDQRMGVDSSEKRRQRSDLQGAAKPQSSADDLNGIFGRATQHIPGVVDQRTASSPPAVPAKRTEPHQRRQ